MSIVTTRMHHSLLFRSEVDVSHFFYGKSIHVSPQTDNPSFSHPLEYSEHSRSTNPSLNLYAEGSKFFSNQLCCGFFLVSKLGSPVNLSADFDDLGFDLTSFFQKVYHGFGSLPSFIESSAFSTKVTST